jgi:hypothetical protein
MEGKLKVLMINNTKDENPSYVMRNKIVGQHLEKLGHEVHYEVNGFLIDFEDYDVFVFSRFYEGTLIKYIQFLKSRGKTIIYETDDNYEAIDENNPYMKIKDVGVLSSRELIELSHGTTVSTPELKAEILKMFPSAKVFVVPNALDFTQYKKRKGGNKKVKVGFQGSNIHVQDLLIVIDAIKELQSELDFDFEIFGIDDRPFKELNKFCEEYDKKWKWMDDFRILYKKLSEINYKHIKTTSYEKYRDKLSKLNWDIGIAPLTNSRFNRSKSCLKFYEYSAVGTVTLASDVIPYSEEMNKKDLVKNRHLKWKSKLRKLIVDEKYRQERLREQEKFVHKHRDIKEIAKHWENVINLIKKNG